MHIPPLSTNSAVFRRFSQKNTCVFRDRCAGRAYKNRPGPTKGPGREFTLSDRLQCCYQPAVFSAYMKYFMLVGVVYTPVTLSFSM